MKILALDSSAVAASVALCEDTTLLAEYTIESGNTHSRNLLPMVESILSLFDLSVDEIDLFATSKGPGSFTGVRIGAATVKGLAFDTKKPCIGVSTLEALAENLTMVTGLVVPVMNARRKQVYTAIFRAENGKTVRMTEDCAIAISELDEILSSYDEPVYLVGDGYEITKELLTHPTLVTHERLRRQSAYSVAQVALKQYQNGNITDDITMVPSYLRPSQAERERNERLQNQSKIQKVGEERI